MAEHTRKLEEEYSYDDSLGTYAHPKPIDVNDIDIDEEFYFGEEIKIGGVPARIDTRDGVLFDRVHVIIDGQQLNVHRVSSDIGVEGVIEGTEFQWCFDAGLDAFDEFLRRVDASVTNEDADSNGA